MPRLLKSQIDARRRVIVAAASCLPPTQLSAKIMQAVEAAIPFDGYRLFAVDPATLPVNRLLAASDNDRAARLHWLPDVYLRTDPLHNSDLLTLIRSKLPVVALQEHQRICSGYPPAP